MSARHSPEIVARNEHRFITIEVTSRELLNEFFELCPELGYCLWKFVGAEVSLQFAPKVGIAAKAPVVWMFVE